MYAIYSIYSIYPGKVDAIITLQIDNMERKELKNQIGMQRDERRME